MGRQLAKKRDPETDQQRDERLQEVEQRRKQIAAADEAVDAMVKRSIKIHGA